MKTNGNFQTDEAASQLTAEGLTFWVKDPEAKEKYIEAFSRSSFDGMLNYYKANFPRPPYTESAERLPIVSHRIKFPSIWSFENKVCWMARGASFMDREPQREVKQKLSSAATSRGRSDDLFNRAARSLRLTQQRPNEKSTLRARLR
ncbi:MAG: hypothetical protein IT422_02670 [Pirellulaceae bacterium]|nr:hypothetical protein [Pirellulaceae bacterium]